MGRPEQREREEAIRCFPARAGEPESPNATSASRAKTWIQAWGKMDIKEAREPHLDQNVLGQPRRGSAGLDSLRLSGGLFSAAIRPGQRPSPIWRKGVPRK